MAKAACAYAEIKAGRADAGIAGLNETLAWFNRSDLRYTRLFYIPWLAEGHLRHGDRAAARPLIDQLLEASRETGYLQLEGRACWLLGECLASEDPASAEDHLEIAIRLFERMEAQNDLAKAMLSRAVLRERAGDLETARKLLDRAGVIFKELGTRDERPRVKAALTLLANGSPLRMLADTT
jgi:hypothetical protein